jgi:signal transduction histidine kinase
VSRHAGLTAVIERGEVPAEDELAEAATGLARENERLQAALHARLRDLRASRARLVEAQAAERRRLERDLHDGAQQRLVALTLELGLAEARVEGDPARARDVLARARSELGLAIDELREIARGIHPAPLTDRGLGEALDALTARMPLPVVRDLELGDERLPEPVEIAAYYVAAEALTNIIKYAGASQALVRVTRDAGRAVIEVVDDGSGGADPARGSGLRGLADRVEALDGRLDVVSPRGGGTRIRATFPLKGARAERGRTRESRR